MIIYITEAPIQKTTLGAIGQTPPAVTLGAFGIPTPSVSVVLTEPPEYTIEPSIWSDREYYSDEANYTD